MRKRPEEEEEEKERQRHRERERERIADGTRRERRGGQILSRGLTAGRGLKGAKCYYCKGYVCAPVSTK